MPVFPAGGQAWRVLSVIPSPRVVAGMVRCDRGFAVDGINQKSGRADPVLPGPGSWPARSASTTGFVGCSRGSGG
jgi:hypothetical protein